jgi:hypothetical protein
VSVVILKGMLFGAGREADCELLAWPAEEGPGTLYSQIRVVDAPLDLPDRHYTLVVESKVYSTEKSRGWWAMVHVELANT